MMSILAALIAPLSLQATTANTQDTFFLVNCTYANLGAKVWYNGLVGDREIAEETVDFFARKGLHVTSTSLKDAEALRLNVTLSEGFPELRNLALRTLAGDSQDTRLQSVALMPTENGEVRWYRLRRFEAQGVDTHHNLCEVIATYGQPVQ